MRGVMEFRHRLMTVSGANTADPYDNYLTIEALEDGVKVWLGDNDCEYCVDGDGNWKNLPAGERTDAVGKGQRLHFRGNITPTPNSGIGMFETNGDFNLLGNVMSMLYGDDGGGAFSLEGKNRAFYMLFYGCEHLRSVADGFLPATTLSDQCYSDMFSGCENLTHAPVLPAAALAERCYENMFEYCTSLIQAPALPATVLAEYCYTGMFKDCKSLTTAPVLPAAVLEYCCYDYMFSGCENLNYIKALFLETDGISHTYEWVEGVSETGTFVKSRDAEWDETGSSGIPEGWEVVYE